ncbi:MAG: hypothetical protein LAP21_02615 [Acidobacteriia bacterium]|nr:hypothetical protein [Terriglobia bacterium]
MTKRLSYAALAVCLVLCGVSAMQNSWLVSVGAGTVSAAVAIAVIATEPKSPKGIRRPTRLAAVAMLVLSLLLAVAALFNRLVIGGLP